MMDVADWIQPGRMGAGCLHRCVTPGDDLSVGNKVVAAERSRNYYSRLTSSGTEG
jgi:hypothetical protein